MKRTRAEIARANGAKSKGPITPEGKANSSRNAVKHALTAYKAFVLQNENYASFEALVFDLQSTHNPVGQHEEHLVWQIAGTIWRERRLWDTETALMDIEMSNLNTPVPTLPNGRPDEAIRTASAFESLAVKSTAMSLLLRYQSRMIRTRERALESLRSLQTERIKREQEQLVPPVQENADPVQGNANIDIKVEKRTQETAHSSATSIKAPTLHPPITSTNPQVPEQSGNV